MLTLYFIFSILNGISPPSLISKSDQKKQRISIAHLLLTYMIVPPLLKSNSRQVSVDKPPVFSSFFPSSLPLKNKSFSIRSLRHLPVCSSLLDAPLFSQARRFSEGNTVVKGNVVRKLISSQFFLRLPRVGWPLILAQSVLSLSSTFVQPYLQRMTSVRSFLRQFSLHQFFQTTMTRLFDKVISRNPQFVLHRPLPSFSETYQFIDMKKAGEIVDTIQKKQKDLRNPFFVLWNTSKDRVAGYANVTDAKAMFQWFQVPGKNNRPGAHLGYIYIYPYDRGKGLAQVFVQNIIQYLLYSHSYTRVSLLNAFDCSVKYTLSQNSEIGRRFYSHVCKAVADTYIEPAPYLFVYYPKDKLLNTKLYCPPVRIIKIGFPHFDANRLSPKLNHLVDIRDFFLLACLKEKDKATKGSLMTSTNSYFKRHRSLSKREFVFLSRLRVFQHSVYGLTTVRCSV